MVMVMDFIFILLKVDYLGGNRKMTKEKAKVICGVVIMNLKDFILMIKKSETCT